MTGALDCVNVVSAQAFVLLWTALPEMNGEEGEGVRAEDTKKAKSKQKRKKLKQQEININGCH